jgi:hypothetical protein
MASAKTTTTYLQTASWLLLVLHLAAPYFSALVHGQLVPFGKVCENATACVECMESEGCGFWQPGVAAGSTGLCADRCLIMDLACYSMASVPIAAARDDETTAAAAPVNRSQEICQVVANDAADAALCGSKGGNGGCEACVATVLSDGRSTCQWFANFEACVSQCGMLGCGETTCTTTTSAMKPNTTTVIVVVADGDEEEDPPASAAASGGGGGATVIVANGEQRDVQDEADAACYEPGMTCSDCMAKVGCGFWRPELEICAASCDAVADNDACYSNATYNTRVNVTLDEICQEIANKEAHLLCSAQSTCGTCVETTILSSITTCQWFDEGQFCVSGCGVDGCGKTSCQAEPVEDDNGGGEPSEGAAPPPPTSNAAAVAASKHSFCFMRRSSIIATLMFVAGWHACL